MVLRPTPSNPSMHHELDHEGRTMNNVYVVYIPAKIKVLKLHFQYPTPPMDISQADPKARLPPPIHLHPFQTFKSLRRALTARSLPGAVWCLANGADAWCQGRRKGRLGGEKNRQLNGDATGMTSNKLEILRRWHIFFFGNEEKIRT